MLCSGSEDQATLEQSKECAEGLQQAELGKAWLSWPKHMLQIWWADLSMLVFWRHHVRVCCWVLH